MLRLFFLLGILSMATACVSMGPLDAEKGELHLRMGTSMLEGGNYPQALSELLKAEQYDSTNPSIQNNLGLAYFARDRLDLAEKHLKNALNLKPNYSDAKNNLGRVLIEANRFADAETYLKGAMNDLTFPNPEKPLLNMGLLYFRQQKFATAREYLVKTLEYQRSNCLAQTLYGRSLFELREYAIASSSLDRAIGFCQGEMTDEPQYYSALAHYQVGDYKKAESRLDEIIRIYPNGRYRERARTMLETMRK